MKEGKKKKSGCTKVLIALFIALAIFLTLVIVLANTVGKDLPKDDSPKAPNSEIQAIMDATGMTLENATEAHDAFVKISDGISVIYSVTYDELLDDYTVENSKGTAAVEKCLQTEEWQEYCANLAMVPLGLTGEEAIAYHDEWQAQVCYMYFDNGVVTMDPASIGIERPAA